MRIERTSRWPWVPRWVIGVVGVYLALVLVGVLLARLTGGPNPASCPFRWLTGHPCPGCGTTRMVLSVAQGNIARAFLLNPLMFTVISIAVALLAVRIAFRRRVVWITSARSRRGSLIILLVAVLANWVYVLMIQ